jgi:hypothetical protein
MTMMLVIQHFLGLICHIMDVINVHKWWDPHVFQGLVLWEHALEPSELAL